MIGAMPKHNCSPRGLRLPVLPPCSKRKPPPQHARKRRRPNEVGANPGGNRTHQPGWRIHRTPRTEVAEERRREPDETKS